jgi:5'-nucleotidase
MRLLVTNDDGIDSVFLHALARGLIAAGHEITVAAPRTEQSRIGSAKSRNRPVESREVDCGFGCPTWVIDGTPSDCVNIALDHLVDSARQPEAVVSGINVGLNASLGFIIASGTVAGAFEGALHGLPSAALSQDLSIGMYDELKHNGGRPDPALAETLRHSADHTARLLPTLFSGTAPRSFIVHNLNFPFPCTPASELRRTVPARVIVPRLFSPASDDGTHRMIFRFGDDLSPEQPLTDRAALAEGFISHGILDYTRLGAL